MDNMMFQELLESIREGGAILRGEKPASREFHYAEPDVRTIRERTGLAQQKFAAMLGVSKRTLENWEQGRCKPTGPARALITIVAADPIGTLRALHEYPRMVTAHGKGAHKKPKPQKRPSRQQQRAASRSQ